jgi:hypothetical protein
MPEHEGRTPAFYDHETDEPRATGRRRRQVADWGVGEDLFDRMPSRRFGRRGEGHRHAPPGDGSFAQRADDFAARSDEPGETRQDAPGRFARRDDFAGDGRDELAGHDPAREAPADWLDEAVQLATDGRRTIVIGGAVEEEIPPAAPRERRTVVIGGHPDGLPVARQRRPPRTAVERVGASPDRIVAYAVALGFLLILIAILTTGN